MNSLRKRRKKKKGKQRGLKFAWTDIRNRMLTQENIDDEAVESHDEATVLFCIGSDGHLITKLCAAVEMLLNAPRLAWKAIHDITEGAADEQCGSQGKHANEYGIDVVLYVAQEGWDKTCLISTEP